MNNSILDLINNQNQNNNQIQVNPQIKSLVQQLKNNPNQQAFINNLFEQNPNWKNIVTLVQSKGLTLQQFAQIVANQKGIELNSFMQNLLN